MNKKKFMQKGDESFGTGAEVEIAGRRIHLQHWVESDSIDIYVFRDGKVVGSKGLLPNGIWVDRNVSLDGKAIETTCPNCSEAVILRRVN